MVTKIRPVSKEELKAAMNKWLQKHKDAMPVKEDNSNIFHVMVGDLDYKAAYVDGEAKPGFNDEKFGSEVLQIIMDNRDAEKAENGAVKSPTIADRPFQGSDTPAIERKSQDRAMTKAPMAVRDMQVQDLTIEDIRRYICKDASDSDLFIFLKFCQAKGLNPMLKEVYLVPYKDKDGNVKCSTIVGQEAFMKIAEQNPQYEGFKSGIIISKGEEMIYREGSHVRTNETLEGGWGEVYRKDRKVPIRSEVSLKEYDMGRSLWTTKKATMIRKVAKSQSHREAFPGELGACYDESEMAMQVDPAKEIGLD